MRQPRADRGGCIRPQRVSALGLFRQTRHRMGSQNAAMGDGLIMDLARILTRSHCTVMLADFGARAIKVEPPAGEDRRT